MGPQSDELDRVDALFELMAKSIQEPVPASTDERLRNALEGHFRGSRRLSALERLDIYRQQYWLRHRESLGDDFPGTSQLLASAWEEVTIGYLTEYPPSTPSLRELGFRLPDYLAPRASTPLEAAALDMARLERAYLEVFDAIDEAPFDAAELAGLGPEDWPRAVLEISRALRLLELSHPVADLRRALLSGSASGSDLAIPSAGQPRYIVVYRRELGLWDQELSADAYDLLQRLAHGEPLGVACEGTARQRPGAASELDAHLSEWFAGWTRLGWITSVAVPEAG